jgi:uncharacterized protein
MTRDEVVATLKRTDAAIRRYGATALFLFGSAARDELRPDSDIDLFIDYEPDGSFTFVELLELKDFLSETLKREVDLTTREGLHPGLRARIEKSSLRVF